ncbi:hypothetical protein A3G63_03400 [Candidatus Kaiserbacteria bacterium RIFCSPLOWO2_12_FULL_52_8]|uniref:Response regulatory domain-containing protein n=1 Tax=Candidatus Kaiserbacteria bacterium RIFCSPHIGHO2_01_FULL_53_31 TaxID=1798481 RepID=A0A1F6CIU2_9BACT|nr:MAG: hypothetical protein A2678_02640 [Candidatus Kaiserbacteria bacterium RIFCSPHIGHO2_01_FULL_53_31]OGG92920.1 MAG: hypothetical protein A3G63_03400 [Candidatus Kaiserbacteria bacterium RIFCSPLOWO2_12_FULL_52_8]
MKNGSKVLRILCIDDKPSELDRARKEVEAAGHKFVGIHAGTKWLSEFLPEIRTADAIITDLHFRPYPEAHDEGDDVLLSGLLVVIHALGLGKPVAVCTEMDTDYGTGHHGKTYSWIHDAYLEGDDECIGPTEDIGGERKYLILIGHKDWKRAVWRIIRTEKKKAL